MKAVRRTNSFILDSTSNHFLMFLKDKALKNVTIKIVISTMVHNHIILYPHCDLYSTFQVSLPCANEVLVILVRRLQPHLDIEGIEEDFGASPLTRDPASRDWEVDIHLFDKRDKQEQVEELV